MPTRCVLGYCSNTPAENVHLFRWPKDVAIARKWTAFVMLTRSDFKPSKHSVLCSEHFTDNDYANYTGYNLGFQAHLRLSTNAIPSVLRKLHNQDADTGR